MHFEKSEECIEVVQSQLWLLCLVPGQCNIIPFYAALLGLCVTSWLATDNLYASVVSRPFAPSGAFMFVFLE